IAVKGFIETAMTTATTAPKSRADCTKTPRHMLNLPRYIHTRNLKKLADALNVTVTYLMDEEESDRQKNIDQDIFLANVKNEFGSRGAHEASQILERAAALFAGGELEDEAKVIFFQSLMEVYFESKAEAKEKFAPKSRRVKRKTS
ncbi:MAG: hypothetical protein LBQ48_04055, partial [Oscillospiraceae bacterium]|nr:hypothetical protein [Oscillospiraceae bacterium]